MKKGIIIIILAFTGSAFGERHERSTVLTDESKRVLDHFDFSNFDKQEALNYLDRQRYDNQIRGKRSQSKCNRSPRMKKKCFMTSDVFSGFQENLSDKKNKIVKKRNPQTELDECITNHEREAQIIAKEQEMVRSKRGHHHKKKKQKFKLLTNVYDYNDYNDEVNYRKGRRRRRRRKKKRKRYYWDKWSEWSPCSVTCGRGRKIRWRKCIAIDCELAEKEMGEKTCQLPACNLLTKILGI